MLAPSGSQIKTLRENPCCLHRIMNVSPVDNRLHQHNPIPNSFITLRLNRNHSYFVFGRSELDSWPGSL